MIRLPCPCGTHIQVRRSEIKKVVPLSADECVITLWDGEEIVVSMSELEVNRVTRDPIWSILALGVVLGLILSMLSKPIVAVITAALLVLLIACVESD